MSEIHARRVIFAKGREGASAPLSGATCEGMSCAMGMPVPPATARAGTSKV